MTRRRSSEHFKDMGWVTALGNAEEAKSVTWINFPGIVFLEAEEDPSTVEFETSVPVSTQDLVEAGVRLQPDENGNIFVVAELDRLDANYRSDVVVSNFTPVGPMTQESQDAWEGK